MLHQMFDGVTVEATSTDTVSLTRKIVIPVIVGEDYTVTLKKRLQEYAITQAELAREMSVAETQLSRWVSRPSVDTGEPMQPRIDTVVKIEKAIADIRARRKREKSK